MIDNVPVLVIDKMIGQIQQEDEYSINITPRFSNDWRCPITNYTI